MAPREFYRVEWFAARSFDRPRDRTMKVRNFTSAENAGDQVASIRLWPAHAQLVKVVRTNGGTDSLDWADIDPDALPISDAARHRYETLAESWRTDPTMRDVFARVLGEHVE